MKLEDCGDATAEEDDVDAAPEVGDATEDWRWTGDLLKNDERWNRVDLNSICD